jgi:hypothetical protein
LACASRSAIAASSRPPRRAAPQRHPRPRRARQIHIGVGIGFAHADKTVFILIDDLGVRVIGTTIGEILRHLTLDPPGDHQPRHSETKDRAQLRGRSLPMSRAITGWRRGMEDRAGAESFHGVECQRSIGRAGWRVAVLPGRGKQIYPAVAGGSPLAHRMKGVPHAGGGLGEADAVAGGEHEVGLVHDPADGDLCDGLGHECRGSRRSWPRGRRGNERPLGRAVVPVGRQRNWASLNRDAKSGNCCRRR